jgi:hypothetical protein
MTDVHLVLGVSVLVLNLAAGVWGGVGWLQRRPSVSFWYLLRVSQVAVVLQVLLGGLLVFQDHRSPDELHYVYGVLPLVVSLLGETVRAGAAQQEIGDIDFQSLDPEGQRSIALAIVRREMGIMAVSALVIFGLALRAAGTSTAF